MQMPVVGAEWERSWEETDMDHNSASANASIFSQALCLQPDEIYERYFTMVAIQPAPRKNIVDLRLLLIYTILSGDYENEEGVLPNFLNYFSKPLAGIMRREKLSW